jgi:hypothetical protein
LLHTHLVALGSIDALDPTTSVEFCTDGNQFAQMASLPVQVALFGSEVIFSHEDATALKLRDFQSKTVGKGAFAHLMDSKDISDFLEASKLKFRWVRVHVALEALSLRLVPNLCARDANTRCPTLAQHGAPRVHGSLRSFHSA